MPVDSWSATAETHATPEQLLEVLTHPEEIRRWSPVDFDVDDLAARRLAAGTRTTVTGRLAGVPVTFEVQVHAADQDRLELSADGPVGFDVRYDLAPAALGAEMTASVAVRRGGGLHRPRGGEGRRGDAGRRSAGRCDGPDRAGGGVARPRRGRLTPLRMTALSA